MALVLDIKILDGIGAITDAIYKVTNEAGTLVDSGVVDIASNGTAKIDLSNAGIPEGTYLKFNANNENSVAFADAGSVEYRLQVTEDGIVPLPTAVFTYTKNFLDVAFDAGTSIDPSGNGLTYDFDFGDGSTGVGVTPSHSFASGGTYDVSLMVTDYINQESPLYTQAITVNLLAPTLIAVAVGDSITSNGDSTNGQGRVASQSIYARTRGAWTSALLSQCDSEYIVRDNLGKSGYTTALTLQYRMPLYLASDADVMLIELGTNDIALEVPQATLQSQYLDIVTQLLASGKKLLLIPVQYANPSSAPASTVSETDLLNAYISSLASMEGVAVSEVCDEYNTLNMLTVDGSAVTVEGIHPNNRGGVMRGRKIADAMDAYYPSNIAVKNNLIPAFTGTGGTFLISDGVAPDNTRLKYAKNTTEVASTFPFDRGDNKAWWKIRSNGGAVSNQNDTAQIELLNLPSYLDDGLYIAEVLIEFSGNASVSQVRIGLESVSATYGACEYTFYAPSVADTFEKNTLYRFRTLAMRLGTEGLSDFDIDIKQTAGDDMIVYIAEPMFYKVEDI